MGPRVVRQIVVSVCLGLAVIVGSSGCSTPPLSSPVAQGVVPAPRIPVLTPRWCEPILARKDLGLALAEAKPDTRVTSAQSALASATVAIALHTYSADTSKGVAHSVDPALIASATVGSMSVLNEPTIMDGKVSRPIWDDVGVMSQVRVGVFSGSRFMGEYVVFADSDESTETMLVDGSYTLAQKAALVLLWDHFGQREFRYLATSDLGAGSWVLGREGKITAGVYLGDCSADSSRATIDGRAAKLVKPGTLLDEPAMAKAFLRISQAVAHADSMY